MKLDRIYEKTVKAWLTGKSFTFSEGFYDGKDYVLICPDGFHGAIVPVDENPFNVLLMTDQHYKGFSKGLLNNIFRFFPEAKRAYLKDKSINTDEKGKEHVIQRLVLEDDPDISVFVDTKTLKNSDEGRFYVVPEKSIIFEVNSEYAPTGILMAYRPWTGR